MEKFIISKAMVETLDLARQISDLLEHSCVGSITITKDDVVIESEFDKECSHKITFG